MGSFRFAVLGCAVVLIWGGSLTAEAADPNGEVVPPSSLTVMPPKDFPDVLIAGSPRVAELASSVAANPTRSGRLVAAVWANSKNGFWFGACLTRTSADGGRTWTPPVSLPIPAGHFGCRTFPTLSYSPDGNRVYAAYASSVATTEPVLPSSSLLVSESLDGGATWQAPRIVLTLDESIEFAAVGTPLRPSGHVYILFDRQFDAGASRYGALLFTRSLDRGKTWSSPQVLTRSASPSFGNRYEFTGAHLATGAAGEVIAGWDWQEDDYDQNTYLRQIRVAMSGDFGQSFAAPIIVADDTVNLSPPQVKIGAARVAHIVYARSTGEVLYTHSYNRRPAYQTWAAPVTVDSTGSNPALALEPCGAASSILNVVWMKIQGNRQSAFYSRKIATPGYPWSPAMRVANASSPVPANLGTALAAGAGRAFAIWTDARHNPPPDAANASNVYGSRISSGVTCAPDLSLQ